MAGNHRTLAVTEHHQHIVLRFGDGRGRVERFEQASKHPGGALERADHLHR
ncbi:Uncharacterised protein [Mycobacteroides abscessus subsp. massiliense]|nr:Uncharacterised protein [Mycobacteroides abscessus subsp. massiliense]